ncbi:hypothetical protein KUTeg_022139 [Tegillarca granosa]|uniref:Uncharacterized protein n=1 Tax=Tegillarca granosa TaxID=220873 RepID=A0ABQ9E668_TEGGR|nr:hypothetical protein KUTeg_022139 [Tegillarca granosa]
MKYEEIVKKLGDFGTYQKRLYFLLCIPAISIGSFMMMIIVVTETPDHRCRIPNYSNDTFAVQGHYHQDLINLSIPVSEDTTKIYDQCHVYIYSNVTTDDNYTYEMNLVCNDALKTSHAQMIYYFGVLSGDLIIGQIADLLGRKIGLYISLIFWIVAAFSVPWSPNYICFVALHFIIGGAAHASFLVCSVIGMELVGPTKRAFTGLFIHIFFAIGLIYVSGIGYFVKQWQLLPESPRWLISKGRRQEANVIIKKAAKVNKVAIPDNFIDSITIETIGGNFFLNFFLFACTEFPALSFAIFLSHKIERKIQFCASMTIGALYPLTLTLALIGKFGASAAFGLVYVLSAEIFPTVVRNSALGACSCVARIGGMLAPYIAKLGLFVGGKFGKALPLCIFGVFSISAGLVSLFLPETLNRKLPDTLEDCINVGRRKKDSRTLELKISSEQDENLL